MREYEEVYIFRLRAADIPLLLNRHCRVGYSQPGSVRADLASLRSRWCLLLCVGRMICEIVSCYCLLHVFVCAFGSSFVASYRIDLHFYSLFYLITENHLLEMTIILNSWIDWSKTIV